MTLDLDMTISEAPSPGSLVRVDSGQEQLWLAVEEAGVIQSHDSPPRDIVRVTGRGMWLMMNPPNPMPDKPRVCEKLTFELWARESDTRPRCDWATSDSKPVIRVFGEGFQPTKNFIGTRAWLFAKARSS